MSPVSPEVAEILTRKKSTYCRYLDTKQWHNFDQMVLPDCDFTFYDTDGSILKVGRTPIQFNSSKKFTSFFEEILRHGQTMHLFGPGELDQTAPDEVTAIWPVEHQLVMLAGLVAVRGGGHYFETWKLKDGDWFIQDLVLKRVYIHANLLARVLTFFQTLFGL